LRKGFSTVVAAARCGNPAVDVAGRLSAKAAASQPAATNRRARHSMSQDRTPSGRRTGVHLTAPEVFISGGLSFAVQYGRLDIAGTPRLRIALPDTRCPRIECSEPRGALCFRNEYSDVVWKWAEKTLL